MLTSRRRNRYSIERASDFGTMRRSHVMKDVRNYYNF
jgi:hypothetical protein